MIRGIEQHYSVIITAGNYVLFIEDVKTPSFTLKVTLNSDVGFLVILDLDDCTVAETNQKIAIHVI